MAEKDRRRRRILDLIQAGRLTSQEQLGGMLRQEGIVATQATLSRDLRELGVVKGPAGYSLPGETAASPPMNGELQRALRTYLVRADAGGNLAVLHTGPGRAQLLALELDRARLRSVLGTVAGDDTIFLATRSPREAQKVLRDIRSLAGIKS
jgi:transcriptional regulator of arginine metabolism